VKGDWRGEGESRSLKLDRRASLKQALFAYVYAGRGTNEAGSSLIEHLDGLPCMPIWEVDSKAKGKHSTKVAGQPHSGSGTDSTAEKTSTFSFQQGFNCSECCWSSTLE
jgi:hypothetical protein